MSEICAVDFTTSTVQILVRRALGHPDGMEAALPEDVIQDGKILQPVAVQLYLSRLWKALKLGSAEIRLCASDSACVTRALEFPKMPTRELERSLRFEVERELPMSPRDAYLGWQVIDAQKTRETVLLVAAWRDVIEGYLEALDGLGRVSAVEPRSLAVARAVGLADALLIDWTGDRMQVVTVEKRRVTYTNSVQVSNGTANSQGRLLHVISSLIPKAAGRRTQLPPQLVLLGELYGREDVAAALGDNLEIVPDWRPPAPYGSFAAASQVANIGLMLRN